MRRIASSRALLILGLSLSLLGATVLAWLDLTAKRPTWESLASDWERRRKYAWVGFPAIAFGTVLGILSIALD